VSYFPSTAPIPEPTIDDGEFWEYCAKHELRVQACTACGRLRFPPKPRCPECLSEETTWERLPGTGSVYTYTVVYNVVEPGLRGIDPYNIVVVSLDGTDGLHMISNVLDIEEDALTIGMPLAVAWDTQGGFDLPRFRRA
jgi:uncharacterized OB-fold protein